MYQKQRIGWKKHLDFIVLDLICLYGSFLLAILIRHRSWKLLQNRLYWGMFFVFLFIQFSVAVLDESFKNVLKRGYYQEFTKTLRHVFLVILLATFFLFIMKEGSQYSRSTMMMTAGMYLLSSYLLRLFWKRTLLRGGLPETRNSSMLVLTTTNMAGNVAENIKMNHFEHYQFSGIALIDSELDSGTFVNGIEIVAGKDTLLEYICREWVDEVFIYLPSGVFYPKELIQTLIGMGVTTHTKLFEATELQGKNQVVERLGNYTVLTNSISMASARQSIYKRGLDIVGGFAGCFLTVILTVVIGPFIYLQSPGPIFFSQIRVGKNGRRFKIYKFRSMYPDAEARKQSLGDQNSFKDGMMFKMEEDPRIIGGTNGIGAFIRRHSIDEFPQFWNVLKGDMSLVGTRPPTVDEWEKYDLHHRVRLAIKPGITGLWQVSGRSNIKDFEEVVRLDLEYITNWTMGLDMKILFKTVAVVFGKEGAA